MCLHLFHPFPIQWKSKTGIYKSDKFFAFHSLCPKWIHSSLAEKKWNATCTKNIFTSLASYWIFQIKATNLFVVGSKESWDHPPQKDTYQVNFPFSWKICFFQPLETFPPPKKNPCLLAMVVWTKITETVQIPWSHLKPREFVETFWVRLKFGPVGWKIQNGREFCIAFNWLKSSPKMNSKQVHPWKIGWIPERKGSCIPSIPFEKVRTCAFQGGYSTKTSHEN